jgi:hypothetical protein
MRTLMCAQGSPEWLEARLGRVTASRMKEILTPKKCIIGAGAKSYAAELIAEKLIGGPDPWKWEGETADMRRGNYCEHEARNFLEFHRGVDVEIVGVCIHDNELWCASPDGLIGDCEGLELKCPAPKTQIQWLLAGGLPDDHRAQIHGGMIVTGRDAWTFLSYCVGLPPLEVRVERDDYTKRLEEALLEFNGIYDDMLAKIMAQREEAISECMARKGDQLEPNMRSFVA